jgi:PAS domain S-box-containing protein
VVEEGPAAERLFELVSDAMPLLTWGAGPDGTRDYFNRTWEHVTGRSRQELVAGWLDSVHPDDRAQLTVTLSQLSEAHGHYEVEYRLAAADGAYRWVREMGAPLVVHGNFTGYVGGCVDITDRMNAAHRWEVLQTLTAGLAPLLDEVAVGQFVLEAGVAALGGQTGSLCMVVPRTKPDDPIELEIAASTGYSAEVVSAWGRFPLDANLPASEAVREGRPVFIESEEDRDTRYPAFANAPVVDIAAHAVVPLMPRQGDCIGAIVIGFPEARTFQPEDRAMLEAFAAQSALAIERARLWRAASTSRERLQFLADASDVLATSLDADECLRQIADLTVPRIADWATAHLFDGRELVRVTLAHGDPSRQAALETLMTRYPLTVDERQGSGRVLRTGKTEVVQGISDDMLRAYANDDDHLALLRGVGFGSVMTIPLRAGGRVVGTVTLGYDPTRPMTDEDVALASELMRRAGVFVGNSLLFRERSEAARALQASLLPPSLPVVPGVDVAARYVPTGEGGDIGGDFYDMFQVAPDRWLVAIGDVCGKGVSAAAVSGLARHTVRSAAVEVDHPGHVLRHLNTVLLQHSAQAGLPESEWEWETRYCTALVLELIAGPGGLSLNLASGGHPLPLLAGAGGIHEIGRPGTLVGVLAEPDFPDSTLGLAPGDVVVAFTDGAIERRNERGDFFGQEGVARVLAQHRDDDADTIAAALEKAVTAFGEGPLPDDMALLVLRVTGGG